VTIPQVYSVHLMEQRHGHQKPLLRPRVIYKRGATASSVAKTITHTITKTIHQHPQIQKFIHRKIIPHEFTCVELKCIFRQSSSSPVITGIYVTPLDGAINRPTIARVERTTTRKEILVRLSAEIFDSQQDPLQHT
jgi:hypothetical protein